MTKFVVEGNDKDGAAVTRNVPVLLGGVDGSGNVQTLLVGTDGSLSGVAVTGDIEIGAVELKNATDDTRAKVGAVSGLAATDNGIAVAVFTAATTSVSTTAYATSLVLKNAPGRLYGLTGYNSKTSDQFIQLHDATALPSNTAVPVVVIRAYASQNFSIDFGLQGRSFATGIVVANSSTGPTLTVGSADCWFDGQVGAV